MKQRDKLRADEAIDAFLESASADEELERIAAMSDAEVDAELVRHGLSQSPPPSAVASAAPQADDRGKVVPMRASITVWLIAAAIVVFLLAGGALVAGLLRKETPNVPEPPPPTSVPEEPPENRVAAARLREQAKAACAAQDWQACADRLDAARGLDLEGDRAPEVQELRDTMAKHRPDKPQRE